MWDIIKVAHDFRVNNQDKIFGDTSNLQEKNNWFSKILVGPSQPKLPNYTPATEQQKTSSKTTIIYIVIAIVIVLLIVGAFFYFKSKSTFGFFSAANI